MAKKSLVSIFVIVIFFLFHMGFLKAQCINLQWNTFIGTGSYDSGSQIELDSAGNIYVIGESYASWGSPINPHSGDADVFVAKFATNGTLIWNTFLGSGPGDYGYSIALDSAGNIYIIGSSRESWGSPINPYTVNGSYDTFVAKLDSNGSLLWHTYLGGSKADYPKGIFINLGNIYITGVSFDGWGIPINPFSGTSDAFVAKLDTNGNLVWNTFLGNVFQDEGSDIASDGSGNIYLTGWSSLSWGNPVYPHSGGYDVFVSKLDENGNVLWNTFLGGVHQDYAGGLVMDSAGNIYVSGNSSFSSWGSPINPHAGGMDSFVAKLNNNGTLLWNTFLGSSNSDYCKSMASDSAGNIYITGNSEASWGTPEYPYSGDYDVYIAKLNNQGILLWNTFFGSGSNDYGYGITSGNDGNIYVTGCGYDTWGSPINPYAGDRDALVIKINQFSPVPDIKANGSDGPISITQSDTLQIKVSLDTKCSTDHADWWLAQKTPSGWFYFNKKANSWQPGLNVTHQGPLFDLNPKTVLNTSGLSPGNYTFYFGVDMNMDGKVTKSCLYSDMVKVTVTQ